MFEELRKQFNTFLDENPIFLEKFKLLKTKKLIFDSVQEEQFQEIYEKLIRIVIFPLIFRKVFQRFWKLSNNMKILTLKLS
jgi:L-cystine uptake protein TcyP (sodium:dicarboxylate symporter family)